MGTKESIHDVPQTSNIYDIVDFTHHSLHYIIVYQQFDYNFDIIPYLSVHSSLETIEYVKAVNLNILYSVDDDYMKYEGFFDNSIKAVGVLNTLCLDCCKAL